LRKSFVLRLTIHHISVQEIVLCPDGYFSQLFIRNMIYSVQNCITYIYYHCFMFVSVFFECAYQEPKHNSQNIIILILVLWVNRTSETCKLFLCKKDTTNHLKHQIFHCNYHVMMFVFPKFPHTNCTQRTQIMLIKK